MLRPSASREKLEKRPTTAVHQQAQPAWHDVLDLCKKGFAAKMEVMGEEILHEVRGEVQEALGAVVKQFADMLESRDLESHRKLDNISAKIDVVQEIAERRRDAAPLDIDFSPVTDEIHVFDAMHAESAQKMLQHVDSKFKDINDNLHEMQMQIHAEAEEEKHHLMTQRLQLAETQMHEASHSEEQAATSQTLEEIQELIQKVSQHILSEHVALETKIMQQVNDRTQALETRADIRAVAEQIKRTESVLNVDFQLILTEVSKIQKVMHMDFVSATEWDPGSRMGSRRVSLAEHLPSLIQTTTQADDANLLLTDRTPVMQDAEANCEDEAVNDECAHETRSSERPEGEGAYSKPKSSASLGLQVMRRVREYWTQTETKTTVDAGNQTDYKLTEKEKKTKERPKGAVLMPKKTETLGTPKPAFADAEALKAQARQALVKPQYNVMDYYHNTGVAQRIARSPWFENITLLVVCVNALWMAIDTDYNDATLLQEMQPVFICGEMFFCTYFAFEVVIRFAAFRKKTVAFRDPWFTFDFFLVCVMALESWILPIMTLLLDALRAYLDGLNLSTLRLIRMVKIIRLTRMAKLLRVFPELKIIVKGIRFASRSVAVFFLLWIILIFIFSIVLTQLNGSFSTTDEFQSLFRTVSISIDTLLVNGILPQQAGLLKIAMDANPIFWLLILGFVLLVSVTIMYMLVGVLVEVMGKISVSEKESMTVTFVASQLREIMESLNVNPAESLSQTDFQNLLIQPDIALTISSVGVDAGVMMDMMDIIYEDLEKKGIIGLSFETMVEIILNLRGANNATVKDVKELIRVMKVMIKESITVLHEKLHGELSSIRSDLGALREETIQKIEDEFQDED